MTKRSQIVVLLTLLAAYSTTATFAAPPRQLAIVVMKMPLEVSRDR